MRVPSASHRPFDSAISGKRQPLFGKWVSSPKPKAITPTSASVGDMSRFSRAPLFALWPWELITSANPMCRLPNSLRLAWYGRGDFDPLRHLAMSAMDPDLDAKLRSRRQPATVEAAGDSSLRRSKKLHGIAFTAPLWPSCSRGAICASEGAYWGAAGALMLGGGSRLSGVCR